MLLWNSHDWNVADSMVYINCGDTQLIWQLNLSRSFHDKWMLSECWYSHPQPLKQQRSWMPFLLVGMEHLRILKNTSESPGVDKDIIILTTESSAERKFEHRCFMEPRMLTESSWNDGRFLLSTFILRKSLGIHSAKTKSLICRLAAILKKWGEIN